MTMFIEVSDEEYEWIRDVRKFFELRTLDHNESQGHYPDEYDVPDCLIKYFEHTFARGSQAGQNPTNPYESVIFERQKWAEAHTSNI